MTHCVNPYVFNTFSDFYIQYIADKYIYIYAACWRVYIKAHQITLRWQYIHKSWCNSFTLYLKLIDELHNHFFCVSSVILFYMHIYSYVFTLPTRICGSRIIAHFQTFYIYRFFPQSSLWYISLSLKQTHIGICMQQVLRDRIHFEVMRN